MALTYKGKEIIGKPTSGYYIPVKTYENKNFTFSFTGLVFDGSTTYAEIPVSLTDIADWNIQFTFSTTESRSEPAIYHQHCLFGYDSGGYLSRDFHIDVKSGNLYVFSGLGIAKEPVGGTVTKDNSDCGIDTGIKINDGRVHFVEVKSQTGQIDVYCDNVLATTLYPTYTLSNTKLYIGCSKDGESVYSALNLYDFSLVKNGTRIVTYTTEGIAEDKIKDGKLIDFSGNNNDATLYGTYSINTDTKTYVQMKQVIMAILPDIVDEKKQIGTITNDNTTFSYFVYKGNMGNAETVL